MAESRPSGRGRAARWRWAPREPTAALMPTVLTPGSEPQTQVVTRPRDAMLDRALAHRAWRWPAQASCWLLCALAGGELSLWGPDRGALALLAGGLGGCVLLERSRRRRGGDGDAEEEAGRP
jgi:hypothetical protein